MGETHTFECGTLLRRRVGEPHLWLEMGTKDELMKQVPVDNELACLIKTYFDNHEPSIVLPSRLRGVC